MKDKFGVEFKEGDFVLKAVMQGRSPSIELRSVTRIQDGKLYLDNSKVPINFPNRLIIFNKD